MSDQDQDQGCLDEHCCCGNTVGDAMCKCFICWPVLCLILICDEKANKEAKEEDRKKRHQQHLNRHTNDHRAMAESEQWYGKKNKNQINNGAAPQVQSMVRVNNGNSSTKVLPMSNKSIDLDLHTPKAVFAHFDQDGDQSLNKEEVRQAFQYFGSAMDVEKFEKTYSRCDKNKDGLISYKEFKKTL
tara:strand:+ start:37 stop:594 length:558 start_codon:yes stop_codon:yes gene_type:complete